MRPVIQAALAAAILVFVSVPALTCEGSTARSLTPASRVAGEGKQPENRDSRDRCKRNGKPRNGNPANGNQKACPDGGERLPQDNRRSPLDETPPLAPLVA